MNYIKINGIWKSISKGFKKENGEWIELNNASSPFLGETIIKNYVDYSSPGMASSSFLAINSLSDLQKANGYTGSIITNSGVTESSEVPLNTSFTKSLYFNGSSFLTLNNYNFGANDFTIEWWEKSTSSSSGTRFMSTYGTSGGTEAGMMIGWWCTTHRMPEIKWTSYNSYSSWNVIGHGSSAGNVDTSGWHHMAYVRNGSNLYVIKDGALINTIAVNTYAMGYNGSLPMCFGRRGSNSANSTCFSGYLCGIRLSNTALYTQFGTYEERVEPDLSLKYKYVELVGSATNGETQYFNDTIDSCVQSRTVNFKSNGVAYVLFFEVGGKFNDYLYYYTDNLGASGTAVYNYNTSTWTNEAYRTIVLDEPATGDVLTFLEANATKLS